MMSNFETELIPLPSISAQPWQTEEDKKLEGLVAKFGGKNWSSIADSLSGRTGKQCRERWRNHLDPSITKEPFSKDEDILIVSMVQEMGTKWAKIAKSLPGRTDNAIKNRYYSSLLKKPHERRLNRFTSHEDELIISIVRQLGTRWTEVSNYLPGRTPKSVKNRYYSALKKAHSSIAPGEMSSQDQEYYSSNGSLVATSPDDSSCESDGDDSISVDDQVNTNNFVLTPETKGICATTPPHSPLLKVTPLPHIHTQTFQGSGAAKIESFFSAAAHIQTAAAAMTKQQLQQQQNIPTMHQQLVALTTGLPEQDMVISAVLCLCDWTATGAFRQN
eukprot:c4928_g1_i1.p1 GENE.c4928_g1_i1~~c4928_g1_i1.p1  ORF type:complete len:332 (-),score=63.20 c4928_g1_i1:233-1228(-)